MAAKRRKKGRAERKGRGLDVQSVLRAFRDSGKPLSEKEIIGIVHIPGFLKNELYFILQDLIEAGKIIRIGKAYGLSDSMNMVTGRLEIQRSGVGFVIPEDKRRKDVFINPRDFGDAWHGDYVAAAITRVRKNKSNEGRIVRIIERGKKSLPCRVVKRMGGFLLCRPTDGRQIMSFMADYDKAALGGEPRKDDVVEVVPGDRLEFKLYSGTVADWLGRQDDANVQEKLVKLNHAIPTEFPERVLAKAADLPEVPGEDDFKGRKDLRGEQFVTIDGANAKDFDDAILVKATRAGFRLWVAIADVSHYVPEDGDLDAEALERGNSYYFPRSVEPMFPERLSNGLCSLNPDVPRLAMTAEMDFSKAGVFKDARFYNSVIQSKARLTYAQVNRALFEDDEAEREKIKDVLPMLKTAEKLARALHALRFERGTLDFDLPEPEIHFNLNGETVDIRPRVRNFAHQLIEEFMIAANEAVAGFLTDQGVPLLYRIHPDPDPAKLESFFKLLSVTDLGEKMPNAPTPADLPEILKIASGTDLDYLVSRMALRTMMQASYSPRLERHFGLASERYCHFTSPIRRYADLVVHRALKLALTGDGAKAVPVGRLQKIADHLSKRERVAMEAEREILKRVTILFLTDKVGQVFTGVINSLTDFGFWVEFREVMAEGMVRLSTLSDDYYGFIPERQELVGERTGRVLRIGQLVTVELVNVDLGRLEVDLNLVDDDRAPGAPVAAVVAGKAKKGRRGKDSGAGERAPKAKDQGKPKGAGRTGESGKTKKSGGAVKADGAKSTKGKAADKARDAGKTKDAGKAKAGQSAKPKRAKTAPKAASKTTPKATAKAAPRKSRKKGGKDA